MNKKGQTKVSGIGTMPDYRMNMDFFVQLDIIFVQVKDRPWQLPTANESELVKATEYENPSRIDLLVKFCEDQESLIQEQEQKIKDMQRQLQDYEQEIYEKDQILQLTTELKPQIKEESKRERFKIDSHKVGSTRAESLEELDYLLSKLSVPWYSLDYENGGN